jgi:hypothetical protein
LRQNLAIGGTITTVVASLTGSVNLVITQATTNVPTIEH